MTKADIINEIVEKTGIARRDVSVTVEALMTVIKENMVNNRENIYLRGFGSFNVKQRARDNHNTSARHPSIQTCKELPPDDEGRRGDS